MESDSVSDSVSVSDKSNVNDRDSSKTNVNDSNNISDSISTGISDVKISSGCIELSSSFYYVSNITVTNSSKHPYANVCSKDSYTKVISSEDRKGKYYRGKLLHDKYPLLVDIKDDFIVIQYTFANNEYDIIVLNIEDPFEGWITESKQSVFSDKKLIIDKITINYLERHTCDIITNETSITIPGNRIVLDPLPMVICQGYYNIVNRL